MNSSLNLIKLTILTFLCIIFLKTRLTKSIYFLGHHLNVINTFLKNKTIIIMIKKAKNVIKTNFKYT